MEQIRKQGKLTRETEGNWRIATAFCLALMPAAGQILAPPGADVLVQPLAAAISAAILTAILIILLPGPGSGGHLLHFLILAASLILLPVFGISAFLLPEGSTAASGSPALVSLCWLLGALLALLARATKHVFGWQAASQSQALILPVHLLFAVAVYATGFWLIATVVQSGPSGPFPAARAILATGLTGITLTIAQLFRLAAAIAGDRKEMAPAERTPLLLTIVAVIGYGLLIGRSAIHTAPGGALTILLVAALLSVFLLRRFPALVLAGLLLFLATPATIGHFLAFRGDPGPLVLLLALPFSIMRTSRRSGGTLARRNGDPPPAVLAAFNRDTTSWLILLDLEQRIVHFPFGSAFPAGRGSPVSFNHIFQAAGSSDVLDLLRELQKPAGEKPSPIRIRLQMTPGGDARPQGNAAQLFEARILENAYPMAWLALSSLSEETELSQRVERAEKQLSEVVLREERLLSLAAHELRTPVAILSMLAEELQSGAAWADVQESFGQSMERITSVFDDLRADSSTGAGQSPALSFSPDDLITQLTESFSAVAASHGITIEASRTDSTNMKLCGDFGRIFIALSKIIHNAIIHSRGTVIRLSVIASRGSGQDVTLTWQIADDGIGISPPQRARIFEPFESGSGFTSEMGHGGTGLGLYTARKAVRMLGGELKLVESDKGCHFVLSLPLRSAGESLADPLVDQTPEALPAPEQKAEPQAAAEPVATVKLPPAAETVMTAEPGPAPHWLGQQALLIEDNRLVGEITRSRLQRLFRHVDWAETGPDGLDKWYSSQYDLILLDQLLPGCTGCEIVREIRKTDGRVPIIGITASTMGSECQALEAAGANRALEKPLSYEQILALAEEFLPETKAGAAE